MFFLFEGSSLLIGNLLDSAQCLSTVTRPAPSDGSQKVIQKRLSDSLLQGNKSPHKGLDNDLLSSLYGVSQLNSLETSASESSWMVSNAFDPRAPPSESTHGSYLQQRSFVLESLS